MTVISSRTLADLRAEWDSPFLADPSDKTASAARHQLTSELAAAILSAGLLDAVRRERTRVGDLWLVTAGWSRETSDRASAAGEPGSAGWYAALGRHEHALLTGDGRGANRDRWCLCATEGPEPDGIPAEEWVRYEYWTAEGRERHGFVHGVCRRLLQAG